MRIGIVIPTLNQRAFLGAALESVLGQAGDFDLRVWVVDGASDDGTVETLRAITDPRLSWISEPDGGQSQAINKGLARTDSDVVAWLNGDDLYRPGALAAVAAAFAANPETQWLIGRCAIIDAAGGEIRKRITAYKNRGLRRFSYRRLLRENRVSQPAVFWRASFGRRIGPLDESLHWTMDYDLWLRMARASAPLMVNRELAAFRLHPASKSGRVDRRQFDEQYAVASRYFDGDWRSRILHRMNVAKIVWAYRAMRRVGM